VSGGLLLAPPGTVQTTLSYPAHLISNNPLPVVKESIVRPCFNGFITLRAPSAYRGSFAHPREQQMKSGHIRRFFGGLFGSILLAGCGGGGSDGSPSQTTAPSLPVTVVPASPSSSIAGVFDGTLDPGAPMTVLMLGDGSYFLVYFNSAPPQSVTGAIVGTGKLAAGDFSSSDGLDLSLVANATLTPPTVTLSAGYVQQLSLNGSLNHTANGQVAMFTSAYNNAYAKLPPLSALAGTYTAAMASANASEVSITLKINVDGTVTGQLSCGCSITATLTPRSDGMAYVANFSMTGGENILSNKTLAGNVYLDAVRNRLYVVGNIVGSTDMVVFVGTKS